MASLAISVFKIKTGQHGICSWIIRKGIKRYVKGSLAADDYVSDFLDIFSAPNQLDELR